MSDADEAFWMYIHDLYARAAQATPEGKHAAVEIELSDGRTFAPEAVQPYDPFLVCEVSGETREILAVRAHDIRVIRIYQAEPEEERVPLGFRVGEIQPGSRPPV